MCVCVCVVCCAPYLRFASVVGGVGVVVAVGVVAVASFSSCEQRDSELLT